MKSFRFLLVALTFLPALPAAAAVQDDLAATVEQVLELLKAHPDDPPLPELKALIGKDFSFYAVARRTLGVNWNQFSEAQQTQFVDQFGDLLVRTYASNYSSDESIQVSWSPPVQLSEKRMQIVSTVRVGTTDIPVEYRLAPLDGRWQVYDLVIENISLVGNYYQQFSALLSRGGPKAVLDALAAKQKPAT